MAQRITGLRVVLASPSDVKREREVFAKVIEQVNHDTARPAGFHLDLWRWETDSRPGFNPFGPQGLIDKFLQIEECDLFVGVFWNRIGSPTKFGKTGTEHEFQTAYEAWKRKRAPEIMFYFNEKPSNLTSDAELAQRGKVLAFKKTFPEEGLYWPYNGHAEFVRYVNEHLRKFIQEYVVRKAVKRRKSGSSNSNGKSRRQPGTMFTLDVGKAGVLRLPSKLLTLLNIGEGDKIDLKVSDNGIMSGVGVSKDRKFNPKTANLMLKRINSSGMPLKHVKFRKALVKRGSNE